MDTPQIHTIREATLTVCASDSREKYADYRCNGTNDNVEIQAALDALPATGGEVVLLDGTYNIEASLVLDSYQTLRGCGRNTILTTTTADVDIITATGGDGSEKVGILIADLCVDGNAGGVANDSGIVWTYVDYSKITNVWSKDNGEHGIYTTYCNHCEFNGNVCEGNTGSGIQLDYLSHYNTVCENICEGNGYGIRLNEGNGNSVTGNTCQGNTDGIILADADFNTISGNSCIGNTTEGINIGSSHRNTICGNTIYDNGTTGIYLAGSDYCAITGNLCVRNGYYGIHISSSDHCNVTGNHCIENSQDTDDTYDNIQVAGDYNLISSNVCRQGALANQPQYGIDIASGTKNIIQGNDLHDAGLMANFNDAGTVTTVEDDNREIGVNQVKRYVYMKNTSAAQRVAGDVVVFKTGVAAGDEFTTTVTLGDDHVLGMVAETIAVNAYGYVQVAGKTTALKGSNDNGNIAIGDFLCASDTAVEAVKAGAGHTTFAIALEVLAAAGPTALDALLINPMTF